MSLPLPGKKADHYLHYLCIELPTRTAGSEGNRAATRFFADRLAETDFYVELSEFDCMDWTGEGASPTANLAHPAHWTTLLAS